MTAMHELPVRSGTTTADWGSQDDELKGIVQNAISRGARPTCSASLQEQHPTLY